MHCWWQDCGYMANPCVGTAATTACAPIVTIRQPRTLVRQTPTKTWASTVQRRNVAVRRVGVTLVVLEWMRLPAMA